MSTSGASAPRPMGRHDRVRKALEVRVGYLGPRMRIVSYLRGFGGEDGLLLNPVATRMYELVDGRRTVGEIAKSVAAAHRADEEFVMRDTIVFMNDMLARGMIERLSAGR